MIVVLLIHLAIVLIERVVEDPLSSCTGEVRVVPAGQGQRQSAGAGHRACLRAGPGEIAGHAQLRIETSLHVIDGFVDPLAGYFKTRILR